MADEVGTQLAGPQTIAARTSVPETDGGGITDAELTALALAADPDRPLDGDAVPLDMYLADEPPAHLPRWYMPPVTARGGRRWRTAIILTIVVAFVVIEAVGLCSSYGPIVLG